MKKKPRICIECGADYPHDDQHKNCIMPTALGECRGQILPPPTEPSKAKP